MKKIKSLILFAILLFVGSIQVHAASASISVSSSAKSVKVGNTVKVTVKVSSSDLGSWEYCISYDSSILKLTKSTADANTCVKAGVVTSTGQKSSTETFTFKALKSGSSKVGVKSYNVVGYSTETTMSTSASSVTIKTMTQEELEAGYSSNAYLKDLRVEGYSLSPTFDKNKYEYSVDVQNEVESVDVIATKEDGSASISGTGNIALSEGTNKVDVVVTAQKGNTLTYTININRKELNPIEVMFKDKMYTFVRKSDILPEAPTFSLTEVEYNGEKIPALHSEITDYTLVGLKDEEGNINLYLYEEGIVGLYQEIKSNSLILYPQSLPKEDKFSDYVKKELDFNGIKVEGYVLTDKSKVAIIYAQNIETGDMNYYTYNMNDSSVQVYSSELSDYYQNQLKKFKYVIYGFVGLSVFLLFLLIVRKPKKKGKVQNNEEVKSTKIEVKSLSKKELKQVNAKNEDND